MRCRSMYAKCYLLRIMAYRKNGLSNIHRGETIPGNWLILTYWRVCSHLNVAYRRCYDKNGHSPFYIRQSCERVFATAADYVEPPLFENDKINNLHSWCLFYSVFILEKKDFTPVSNWRARRTGTGKVEPLWCIHGIKAYLHRVISLIFYLFTFLVLVPERGYCCNFGDSEKLSDYAKCLTIGAKWISSCCLVLCISKSESFPTECRGGDAILLKFRHLLL